MRRIVTGSIICLLLSGLPFLSACRCLPCMSGVPYQDLQVKGDRQRTIAALPAHTTRTAAVTADAGNN